MRRERVYVVGKGPAPAWCRDLIMPFQKKNGKIGFEFHGYMMDYDLNVGDKLILRDGKIEVRREAARHESRNIPASNKEAR